MKVNVLNTILYTDTGLCTRNPGHVAGVGSQLCQLPPSVAGSRGLQGFPWWEWWGRQARGVTWRGHVTAVYHLVWKHFFILGMIWHPCVFQSKQTRWVSPQAPQSGLRLLFPTLYSFNIYVRKCLAFWSLWKCSGELILFVYLLNCSSYFPQLQNLISTPHSNKKAKEIECSGCKASIRRKILCKSWG